MGASKLFWSTWWLREGNGVGVSIQESEEGPGGQKEWHPSSKDRGAFPCHMLVREGALFLEGLGEVLWGGGEHKERKWEGKKEDLQVQSEITGTSVGYSKRLSRAEG